MADLNPVDKLITCGIRWGSSSESFAGLSLNNNIAMLSSTNKGAPLFNDATKNDLITLKDGFYIMLLVGSKLAKSCRGQKHLIDICTTMVKNIVKKKKLT